MSHGPQDEESEVEEGETDDNGDVSQVRCYNLPLHANPDDLIRDGAKEHN